jgi:hypothetical protein
MRALGIPCSHEAIFRPRATLHEVFSWHGATGAYGDRNGESSWLAWPWLFLFPIPVPILHTVRNPWAVIDSLAFRNDLLPEDAGLSNERMELRDLMRMLCPDAFKYSDAPSRAAEFVVSWNGLIEMAARQSGCPYFRYRVEDMDAAQVRRILDFIGESAENDTIATALENTPHNVNGGRQLEHNLEIKNEALLTCLKTIAPDLNPIVGCLASRAAPKTPEEIQSLLKPDLRNAVAELAQSYGYRS